MPTNYDHLKLIIQRFDTYISGANTKGAFLLAFNTFLCGGILSNYKTFVGIVGPCVLTFLKIGLLLIFLCGILCLIIVLRAVNPFLKSGNSSSERYHSHIYFGSVAEFDTADKYVNSLIQQEEADNFIDLAKQIHILANTLKKKYRYLENATKIIFIQLVLAALLAILIIFDSL